MSDEDASDQPMLSIDSSKDGPVIASNTLASVMRTASRRARCKFCSQPMRRNSAVR